MTVAMQPEENLFKEERITRILQILQSQQRVAVAELSERFRVSEDTIRRDLRDLKGRGLVRKTHGGALQGIASAPPYTERLARASGVKDAIGRRAAELVQEGETIIIDSGSTTLFLAQALSVNRVRVLTNSLEIAHVIAKRPQYELMVLGGKYDTIHQELVGPVTVEQVSRYRVDKLFMGMTAIDRKNGVTDVSEADAALKQAMISVAQQVIGLADHTKVGRVSFSVVAPASALDMLITDDLAECSAFGDLDWQLIQVPSSTTTEAGTSAPDSWSYETRP
jgi:DeoR family fructose operon transcriptional repressor